MRTDEDLAAAVREGDRAAGQILFGRYQSRLFGLAYRLLRNRQDALEAVQQAMVKALANIHRYDPTRRFSPWIYRITRNTCIDFYRRRRPQDEIDDRVFAARTFDEGGSRHMRSADSTLFQKELNAALDTAMDTLGDKYREIIDLYHYKHLSYREIADLLELPDGTVMNRLFRARRKLQTALEAQGITP
jgi:RNA polymerase sigma-70 factor (ECF subfamily)